MELRTLIIVVVTLIYTTHAKSLKMIVQLARHGARTPLHSPVEFNWSKGMQPGELTDVGRRMHYLLGKNVRIKYKELFGNSLLSNGEYFVQASPFNRTIESAFSNMHGFNSEVDTSDTNLPFTDNSDPRLMPPQGLIFDTSKIDFKTALPEGYVTLPVHSRSINHSITFNLMDPICPKNYKLVTESWDALDSYFAKNDVFLNHLNAARQAFDIPSTFKNSTPFRQCYALGDMMNEDYRNNPNARFGPKDELYKYMIRCYWIGIIAEFNQTIVAQVTASPILEMVSGWFNESSQNSEFPLKYALFAGHDDTLNAMLTQMNVTSQSCMQEELNTGVYNPECNPGVALASNIVWELYKDDSTSKYTIKVAYNGEYIDYCKNGRNETGYECDLNSFMNITNKSYTVPYPLKYCGLIPDNDTIYKTLVWWAGLVIIFLFIIISGFIYIITSGESKLKKLSNSDIKLRMNDDEDGRYSQIKVTPADEK